jgi:2-oxoisovalerate dehydrogenase E2 component (dihydrolipoyl transacylase)
VSQYIFKMPDLGEGTVDAEIVAWHAKPGDAVEEDQLMVEVMTDKAAVEVPAPVSGRIVSVTGAPGDKVAVGAALIVFEIGETTRSPGAPQPGAPEPGTPQPAAPEPVAAQSSVRGMASEETVPAAPRVSGANGARPGRIKTSPANRRRAQEAGIDLAAIAGTGPGGRILRADLDRAAPAAAPAVEVRSAAPPSDAGRPDASGADGITEIKVIGLRRLIAERMSEAKRNIPHFAYVEEIDVTELESLRLQLNHQRGKEAGSLSLLPLVVVALTRVLAEFPQINATYDAARGVIKRHHAVHVGIAAQTPDGLKVPVLRHAQSLSLWQAAAEIRRLAEAARANKATREELGGSTITVTSLGKLGGIASTPIINAPEVAIIGLNKAVERPVVHQGAVAVRRIMNLSSSFDHRFVDGYDAAAMIQSLKGLLEHPAMIFIPKV